MSSKHRKHKKYRKYEYEDNNINSNNNNNNNSNNSNNIMDLLNNIDQEQLSKMLSNFNFDNQGSGENSDENQYENVEENNQLPPNDDKTLQLLYALRPIVGQQRAQILEKIIQLYSVSRILNNNNNSNNNNR